MEREERLLAFALELISEPEVVPGFAFARAQRDGALELTLGVGGAIGVDQHRAEGQAQAGVVRRELHAFVEDCARRDRGARRLEPLAQRVRFFDRGRGRNGLAGGEMRAGEREPDLLRGEHLPLRGRERMLEALARALVRPACELLDGDLEQRSRMLRQRAEDLVVDATRVGGAAGRFVARGKREGVLNGELHRRERAGDRAEVRRHDQPVLEPLTQ